MIFAFGFGGISPWSLLIILVIVVLIFGTKRLKNAGGDLGSAVKNFKKGMQDGEGDTKAVADQSDDVIDAEVKQKHDEKS